MQTAANQSQQPAPPCISRPITQDPSQLRAHHAGGGLSGADSAADAAIGAAPDRLVIAAGDDGDEATSAAQQGAKDSVNASEGIVHGSLVLCIMLGIASWMHRERHRWYHQSLIDHRECGCKSAWTDGWVAYGKDMLLPHKGHALFKRWQALMDDDSWSSLQHLIKARFGAARR